MPIRLPAGQVLRLEVGLRALRHRLGVAEQAGREVRQRRLEVLARARSRRTWSTSRHSRPRPPGHEDGPPFGTAVPVRRQVRRDPVLRDGDRRGCGARHEQAGKDKGPCGQGRAENSGHHLSSTCAWPWQSRGETNFCPPVSTVTTRSLSFLVLPLRTACPTFPGEADRAALEAHHDALGALLGGGGDLELPRRLRAHDELGAIGRHHAAAHPLAHQLHALGQTDASSTEMFSASGWRSAVTVRRARRPAGAAQRRRCGGAAALDRDARLRSDLRAAVRGEVHAGGHRAVLGAREA